MTALRISSIDAWTLEQLRRGGFAGSEPFERLRPFSAIPVRAGVYIVYRPGELAPEFLEVSTGGWFKDRDPSVLRASLEAKWVDQARVVYIGKGDNMRRRIRQYADFGRSKPVGHWGGRYIWQLADSADLLVAWKPAAIRETAGELERRLVAEFKAAHGGRLPFANLREA